MAFFIQQYSGVVASSVASQHLEHNMANTPQAFVPNLNLDDPTRGVIAELRSSCVKLSGAVDALEQGLERRVENLRTETLQAINDEGGLIRAHFSNVWAESQNSRELKSYTNQSGS